MDSRLFSNTNINLSSQAMELQSSYQEMGESKGELLPFPPICLMFLALFSMIFDKKLEQVNYSASRKTNENYRQ